MASDYTKIRRAIQEAKHLTDAERDALVNMLWQPEYDERMLVDIKTSYRDGRPYLKATYGEPYGVYDNINEYIRGE